MNHDLVNSHYWLVQKVSKVVKRRFPRHIDINDIESAGGEGLMQASKTFDHTKGASFITFASHRITGAIYDWIRQEYGRKGRRKPLVFQQLETGHDSPLVLKDKEWHKDPLYFKYDPFTVLSKIERWEYLKLRAHMGHRYRGRTAQGERLIDSYYASNASQAEIARDLAVSESRVSQMHAYLLQRYAVMLAEGIMTHG